MTEVRVSERIDLDAGEAGDRRSDTPMDVAMEIAIVGTSIAAGTVGPSISVPIESNRNRKRSRRSEAPAAPSDLRSRLQRRIRLQAHELTQLHRAVGHLANLREVRAARKKAQWQGMMAWMQLREQKWDARHEDNKLWGAHIKIMIAKILTGVAPSKEGREKEREMTARTDVGGLEVSQHADPT